jgi:hypothetical protein
LPTTSTSRAFAHRPLCGLATCVALASILGGCSDEPPEQAASAASSGGGAAVGDGCPPGELAQGDGACRRAGVPDGGCAAGFVSDSDGSCAAVLPEAPCPDGWMALPGETSCREVAPCGEGRWGFEPTDPGAVQFVDASYPGADSDGGESKPWTSIQAAIDAAQRGDTIAIAAGSYHENPLIQSDPVVVQGRCPGLVEVVGDPGLMPAFVIATAAASGTRVRGIAVRGGSAGIAVSGAEDVLIEEVWVHDTPDRGVDVEDAIGATEVTLRSSLVERAAGVGIYAAATSVKVEGCVVRDTEPEGAGFVAGHGVQVQAVEPGDVSIEVRGSVIERSTDMGMVVMGARALVEATVVRDTAPSVTDGKQGRGLHAQFQESVGQRSSVTVIGSVFERNHEIALSVASSDLQVETTVVRDTWRRAIDGFGGAAWVVLGWPDLSPTSLVVRQSLAERSHQAAVVIGGGDASLESVWIRDTLPGYQGQGRGVNVQSDPEVPRRTTALLRGCVIERSRDVGIFAAGADVDLDSVRVSDTLANEADQTGGRGVSAQAETTTAERSVLHMRSSLVERSREGGVFVIGCEGVLEDVVVRDTMVRANDGSYGDGVASLSFPGPAQVAVTGSRIEASARAGVVAFGGAVVLGSTVLECNPIPLDGETYQGVEPSFTDEGGNTCGCAGATSSCAVASSSIAPPEPLPEPPRP